MPFVNLIRDEEPKMDFTLSLTCRVEDFSQ